MAISQEGDQASRSAGLESRVNLRSPFISQIDAGDSADHGYALMTRPLPDYELRHIIKFKERWRYVPLPGDLQEVLEAGDRPKLIQRTKIRSYTSSGF